MQTRDGAPQLGLRIDNVYTNAPVQEVLGGGAMSTYTTPVLSTDLPSDHAPMEIRFLPPRVGRRRVMA